MTDAIPEPTDSDQERVRAIADCLESSAEYAARAMQLAVAHRLFGRSPNLREASREANTAKLACDQALQLLARGQPTARTVRVGEPEAAAW